MRRLYERVPLDSIIRFAQATSIFHSTHQRRRSHLVIDPIYGSPLPRAGFLQPALLCYKAADLSRANAAAIATKACGRPSLWK